jgi:hypothetical protein
MISLFASGPALAAIVTLLTLAMVLHRPAGTIQKLSDFVAGARARGMDAREAWLAALAADIARESRS